MVHFSAKVISFHRIQPRGFHLKLKQSNNFHSYIYSIICSCHFAQSRTLGKDVIDHLGPRRSQLYVWCSLSPSSPIYTCSRSHSHIIPRRTLYPHHHHQRHHHHHHDYNGTAVRQIIIVFQHLSKLCPHSSVQRLCPSQYVHNSIILPVSYEVNSVILPVSYVVFSVILPVSYVVYSVILFSSNALNTCSYVF